MNTPTIRWMMMTTMVATCIFKRFSAQLCELWSEASRRQMSVVSQSVPAISLSSCVVIFPIMAAEPRVKSLLTKLIDVVLILWLCKTVVLSWCVERPMAMYGPDWADHASENPVLEYTVKTLRETVR